MLKVFGIDPTVAAAYTLDLHAALWMPITLLGLWYMVKESLGWYDFDRAVAEIRSDSQGTAQQGDDDISLVSPTSTSNSLSSQKRMP